MHADSFFAMGGYAAYVWGSFGAFAVVLVWNIAAPLLHRRSVLKQLVDEAGTGGDEE